jgi:hypothetical protein
MTKRQWFRKQLKRELSFSDKPIKGILRRAGFKPTLQNQIMVELNLYKEVR